MSLRGRIAQNDIEHRPHRKNRDRARSDDERMNACDPAGQVPRKNQEWDDNHRLKTLNRSVYQPPEGSFFVLSYAVLKCRRDNRGRSKNHGSENGTKVAHFARHSFRGLEHVARCMATWEAVPRIAVEELAARSSHRAQALRELFVSYETTGNYPPAPALIELARALRVSADELLGLKAAKADDRAEDPEMRRLWKKFQLVATLPDKDQRAVIRLINSLARTDD